LNARTPHDEVRLLRAARSIVADLRAPQPWIYWLDLLVSATVLWFTLAWGAVGDRGAAATTTALVVAGLSVMRTSMFLHEIAHLAPDAVPGFRIAWNILVGIPFGIPSIVWERSHRDHHKLSVYRTVRDPEHAPDESRPLARVLTGMVAAAALPLGLAARWLILGPLSLLHPGLRRFVLQRATSLTMNAAYRPSPWRGRARLDALAAEALSFAWCAALAAVAARGGHAVRAIALGAGAVSLAAVLTVLRGEILHRFEADDRRGTLAQQVFESVTIPHTGVVSALLLPLGIGYHAVHHLDARLPYHALGKAHARLVARLPPGSAYHATVIRGPVAAAAEAIARASARPA
jgi:fatty acid desaturase